MKPKIILYLALILSVILSACSTVSISPKADKIIQETARYYENLNSFEGTNTITDEGSFLQISGKAIREKQFAFLRPDKFLIRSQDTNESQLICDGQSFYVYKPYYFNSYTVTPAPKRFEYAVTNWVGGELVRLMVNTNLYGYALSGFGNGLKSLQYAGDDDVSGVNCHHLFMELEGRKTADLWIAKTDSPVILKYSLRFPIQNPSGGMGIHTETISGWNAGRPISSSQFAFTPPQEAIEQPAGMDQVELSQDLKTGATKVRFYRSKPQ